MLLSSRVGSRTARLPVTWSPRSPCAAADADRFGISVCTVDGQRLDYGDWAAEFSIQSCIKPFVYAFGIEENGLAKVQEHVGIEPSGLAFNEVSLNADERPHNPMVNAGAMATISLIGRGLEPADAFRSFMEKLTAVAGGESPGFSQVTYLSEIETAWRNNALLYYMEQHGVFPHDVNPDDVLDMYIQACAVEVDTHRSSTMAATLANGGVCPITAVKCMSPTTVKAALTLMFSCGMYDYSGHWMTNVGVPAKSGVAGLVYIVVPNVMGIAVYSPPLDAHGNSVRGVAFFERLMAKFNYGLFDKFVADGLAGFDSLPLCRSLLDCGAHTVGESQRWLPGLTGGHAVMTQGKPASKGSPTTPPRSQAGPAPASQGGASSFDVAVARAAGPAESPGVLGAGHSSVRTGATDPAQTTHVAAIAHRAAFYTILHRLWVVYRHCQDLWRWEPDSHIHRAGCEIAKQVAAASAKRTRDATVGGSGLAAVSHLRSPSVPPSGAASGGGKAATPEHRRRLDSEDEQGPEAFAEVFVGGEEGDAGEAGMPGSGAEDASTGTGSDSIEEGGALSWGAVQRFGPGQDGVVRCIPLTRMGALLAASGIMATCKGHVVAFNLLVDVHVASGAAGVIELPALIRAGGGGPNILLSTLLHHLAMPQFSLFTSTLRGLATSSARMVDAMAGKAPRRGHVDGSRALEQGAARAGGRPQGGGTVQVDAGAGTGVEGSDDASVHGSVQGSVGLGGAGGEVGQHATRTGMAQPHSGRPIRTADDVLAVLSSLNPHFHRQFAVSVCTVDGQQYTFGAAPQDTRARVPLMETVKPLLYALALHDAGHEAVHEWVDIEPTSSGTDSFQLLKASGEVVGPSPPRQRPHNPFTLSGALAVCSTIGRAHLDRQHRVFKDSGGRFDHVRNTISAWAGGAKVGFNNPMFLALKRRALRAVALSHYLKGMGCYPARTMPDDNALLYYQAMSVELSVAQLAVIAGTLANTGVCPLTQEACLHPGTIKSVLSLMYACGMNAYGGKWCFNIGVPATTGSSGCLMMVMPGVMGLVVQHRELNAHCVPLRGLVLATLLTSRFRLNLFDQLVYGDEDIALSAARRETHKTSLDVSPTVLFFELCAACALGDVGKVKVLLRWGAPLSQGGYDGRTPLHIACAEGHAGVADLLILRGAPVDAADRWGVTPLEDAQRSGMRGIVRLMQQALRGELTLRTPKSVAPGTPGGVPGGKWPSMSQLRALPESTLDASEVETSKEQG